MKKSLSQRLAAKLSVTSLAMLPLCSFPLSITASTFLAYLTARGICKVNSNQVSHDNECLSKRFGRPSLQQNHGVAQSAAVVVPQPTAWNICLCTWAQRHNLSKSGSLSSGPGRNLWSGNGPAARTQRFLIPAQQVLSEAVLD